MTECYTLIQNPKYLIWKLNNVNSKLFGIVATKDVFVSEKSVNEGQRWLQACLKKLFIFRSSHAIDGVLHSDPKSKYLIWKLDNVKSKPFGIVATEKKANEGQR